MVIAAFKVQKVFQLQDRLVLVSDAIGSIAGFQHGGVIELKRPDGSIIRSKAYLELPSPPSAERAFSFSIEPGYQKIDIPEGTEIWFDEGNGVKSADGHLIPDA